MALAVGDSMGHLHRVQVRDGDRVLTEVSDGEFESTVVNLKQLELFE